MIKTQKQLEPRPPRQMIPEETLEWSVSRVLDIMEKVLGKNHPTVSVSLNNLSHLYYSLCRYALAEPFYKRALRIREVIIGPDHPEVALPLNNLALLHQAQGKYAEALPLLQQAVRIAEKSLGRPEHPYTITLIKNLKACQDAIR